MEERAILDEQLAYYRARAPEYDEWFLRQGRYDRGLEHRAEWFREIATVEAALHPIIQMKEVVELACAGIPRDAEKFLLELEPRVERFEALLDPRVEEQTTIQ
jgi:hypothetical protein